MELFLSNIFGILNSGHPLGTHVALMDSPINPRNGLGGYDIGP